MRALLVIGLIFGFYWIRHIQERLAPPVSAHSIASMESCTRKKECAIIYVAPWCPACHQLMPHFIDLAANSLYSDDIGVQIIVGQGKEAGDNERLALDIGVGAIVDNDMTYAKTFKVDHYPAVFVLDQTRRIVKRDQEAINWMSENLKVRE